ncbi:MAG: LD-carboxypeptidase [Micavibrio aeruginosavorus]|uniref:LD-carboxypeptidase n=1 Tax=Micavibrio aeruginosavorus TaxID=349221 RepID=A0A2W5FTS5_9BACT|nr:MAG: LD-carboxypeptidase [Micavibrio aeruginosavorus]
MSIIPPPLLPGDTIGIMAPSSRANKENLQKFQTLLEKRGYKVFIHPQTFLIEHQSAGTGMEKAAAFHDLIRRKDIKAIFFSNGGNRAGTMLEHLNFDRIAANPKIIMGYSDVTALLNAIHKKTGLVTYHGPMARSFLSLPKKQIDQCFDLLEGKTRTLDMPKARILKEGKAKGHLVGGNLSVLCSLLGTQYQPDFKNAILFLEDIAEETSHIDRYLWQLRNAGALHQIKALILGSFTDLKDTGTTKYGFSLKDCVEAVTADLKIPVLLNAPFGHGKDLYTLPVGAKASLTKQILKF